MRSMTQVNVMLLGLVLALAGMPPAAGAGVERNEFPFEVLDFNDCTGESVLWTAVVTQTLLVRESPSGQGLILDTWLFEAIIESQESDDAWVTKGVSNYVETYSANNTLTGGFLLIENAILKPLSEGAPRIKLDANIRFAFNADGELVVARETYTYDCRNG